MLYVSEREVKRAGYRRQQARSQGAYGDRIGARLQVVFLTPKESSGRSLIVQVGMVGRWVDGGQHDKAKMAGKIQQASRSTDRTAEGGDSRIAAMC